MRLSIVSGLIGLAFLPEARAVTSVKVTNWNTNCSTESTVDCTFFDEKGIKRSCLTLSSSLPQTLIGSVTPFISVQRDKCAGKTIQATITMQVCNKKAGTIFTDSSKTKAFFGGQMVGGFDTIFDKPLLGNSCHTFTFEKEMDLCQEEYTYSMAFEGSVTGGNCGNYQWLKSTVQLYDPPPLSPSRIESICKKPSDNGRLCDTSVALSCTYEDKEGTKSCVSLDNDTPFLKIQKSDCGIINAKVTMEMCNNIVSTQPDDTLDLWRTAAQKQNDKHARFKFSNTEYFPETLYDDLAPGQCTTVERIEQINTCNTQYPMSVRLASNRPLQDGSSYCYCWLFRRSTIQLFDSPEPVDPTPAPTDPPVMSPTVISTPNTILITEAVDLDTGNLLAPKYIELYAPNAALRGSIWPNDYFVVVIKGGVYDWTNAVSLRGKLVDNAGFMTFCNSAANTVFSSECDYISNNLVNSLTFGCDSIAIVEGSQNSFTVLDMYGVAGDLQTCIAVDQDFRGGRAERKISVVEAKPTWNRDDWIITPIASRWHTDPDVWDNQDKPPICDPRDVVITEVADPSGTERARFVELYFEDCAGKIIPEDIRLVRYSGNSLVPGAPIHLIDEEVPADGFIVLCATNKAANSYPGLCDLIVDIDSAADVDGGDQVAVIDGPIINNSPVILDIYGVPGQSGPGTANYFKNGRATRKKPSSKSPVWRASDWIVYPGLNKPAVFPKDCDPRAWMDQIIITEVVDLQTGNINGIKFVELHVPNTSNHGTSINNDLKLVVFKNASPTPDWSSAISLNGAFIELDGFIVFCNSPAASSYAEKCDYVVPNKLTDSLSLGCDVVAIVLGNETKYKIIDVYGTVGAGCSLGNHDFSNGRAYRIPGFDFSESEWAISHWSIKGAGQPDPHDWRPGADAPVPVAVPVAAPVSAPVKAPSTKKNNKKTPAPVVAGGIVPPTSAPVIAGGVFPPTGAPAIGAVTSPSSAPVVSGGGGSAPTGKGAPPKTATVGVSTVGGGKGAAVKGAPSAPSGPSEPLVQTSQAEFLQTSSSSALKSAIGAALIALAAFTVLF